MANEINLIAGSEAIKGLDSLIEKLNVAHNSILQISQDSLNLGKSLGGVKSPSGLNDFVTKNKQVTDSLVKLGETQKRLDVQMQKSVQTSKQMEQQSIKESNARNSLNKQRETALRTLDKEQQKLSAAQNLYNKTQQQLNLVQAAYNNLATKKERYNNLTTQEEARLKTLSNVTEKYNTTLKAVDATVGKHTRNVGNYASAFNPLSNSINQLGREAPAFANSVQTGFMAISNNLPIFFDAMGNVIAQNKELQAQGLPTKSVLSQLATSLFSFQTLLSVGVTLLTVYGKEIVNWASALFGASDALSELNKNQKEFNNAKFQGKKDAQSDIIELKKYLAVYNTLSLSDKDRMIAFDKMSSKYPYYIQNTKDATIVNGKYSDSLKKLFIDLERQKALDIETDLQVKNNQKLLDLEKEIKLQKEAVRVSKIPKISGAAQLPQTDPIAIYNAQNKLNNLYKDRDAYEKAIVANQIKIIDLTNKRIGLEYQDKKQTEEKIKNLKTLADLEIKQADFYASDFALRKKLLENSRDNNKLVSEDETKTLEQRTDAYDKMMQAKRMLVEMSYVEEKRVINKEEKDTIEEIKNSYKDRIEEIKELENDKNVIYKDGANDRNQALQEKEKALTSLTVDSLNKRKLATQNYTQSAIDLANEYAKEVIPKLSAKLQFNVDENSISQSTLDRLVQFKDFLNSFTDKESLKDFEDATKAKTKITEDETVKMLELQIARETNLLEASKGNVEEYETINKRKIALEIQLENIKIKNSEKEFERLKKIKEEQIAYLETFKQSWDSAGLKSLDFFLKLEKNGKTAFQNLTEGALDTKEELGVIFNATAEVFQEAMNLMNQASERNYQNEIKRLDSQKNIAIGFAGESATAKAEVERQYEEKRKQLERKRAEQKKKEALYNAIIDTAQAVITGFVESGYVGAIFAAALGAAQIAIISSQEIPAYFEGGTHDGGKMLVNDAKGSNYKETIVLPNGNILKPQSRNVLMDAPKGTEIYTPEQWHDMELNKMLERNGISNSLSITNAGINKDDFNAGINKLYNKESFSFVRDVNGERIYKHKQGMQTELVNNRLNIKSFNV
jgi:hypothetical protein